MACDTCGSFNTLAEVYPNLFEAEWLKEKNLLQRFFASVDVREPLRSPLFADTPVLLQLPPNQKILYWAAEASAQREYQQRMHGPKRSYDYFANSGIAQSDGQGRCLCTVRLPAVYKTRGEEAVRYWPRHLHYVLLKESSWGPACFTKVLLPELSLERVEKAVCQGVTVCCAIQAHQLIPGTTYSSGPEDLLARGNRRKDPVIVYCAHRDCPAAEHLAERLIRAGFANVFHFPGGLEEFRTIESQRRHIQR